MIRNVLLVVGFIFSTLCASSQMISKPKKTVYEEVDFEDVIKRYFGKSSGYSIEGIYSVSCVITRRNKRFLSKAERIRIIARQDNYAKVAIMKDWPESRRDFIEVSLSYKKANTFPIMGELDIMANDAGYMYTHIEPDGSNYTFTMLESDGLLEAEYSLTKKARTITYRLSYLKIFPTAKDNVTVYEYR
ncbi:MAG TPA: hypothetical protein VIQ51_13045 [Chryseosolibacter sp.]